MALSDKLLRRLLPLVRLLVFNKIGDVKALGRCCVVSRRLLRQVPAPFSALFRLVLGGIVKPLQALGQLLGPNRRSPNGSHSALSVDDPDSITAERCHAVAKLLTSHQMVPQRVLILDSVQTLNFRGKLSRDEAAAFKLETTAERKAPSLKLEYFPSGSVVDGLGAALLAACEIKNIRAALCVTWPQFGAPVLSLIRSHIFRAFDLELSIDSGCEDYVILGQDKDHQHPCNERKGTGETISDKDHFLQASQLLNNDSDQTTGERLTKRKKNSCQKIDGRTHLSICYILNATILCIEQHHLQALQSPLLQLFAAAASTLIKVGEELQ